MIWEYLGHQCLWLVCTVRGIDIHGIRTMQATSERCECGRRKVQRMSSPIQPLLLDKFKIHQLLIGWIFSPSLPEAEWIEPLKRERERDCQTSFSASFMIRTWKHFSPLQSPLAPGESALGPGVVTVQRPRQADVPCPLFPKTRSPNSKGLQPCPHLG